MRLEEYISNPFFQVSHNVWALKGEHKFNYSDGLFAEKYLEKVLSATINLSSNSDELEKFIIDWPSEYHLSHLRSALLRIFHFDRNQSVLEIGGGCGAISRYLGEIFGGVLTIEGSLARSKLAGLRTKDLRNVKVLCAPFQNLEFINKFNLVFCIGVLEYAAAFSRSGDPYQELLQKISSLLSNDGCLILAIENQYGLKYFSSSAEDHTGLMFDGIEGYSHYSNVRTFGYYDLKKRLLKEFSDIQFYFPYPDYKLPTCILSENLIKRVSVAEMISQIASPNRGWLKARHCFDDRFAVFDLDRNDMLPFFSNSFLIVASKNKINPSIKADLGILFSRNRKPNYRMVTKILEPKDSIIIVDKKPERNAIHKSLSIRFIGTQSEWIYGLSIHTQIILNIKKYTISMNEIMLPVIPWLRTLKSYCSKNGHNTIPGIMFDSVWSNAYYYGEKCTFIDQEWEWIGKWPLTLQILFIRSAFLLLRDIINLKSIRKDFNQSRSISTINQMADSVGLSLAIMDYLNFIRIESTFGCEVEGSTRIKNMVYLAGFLLDKKIFIIIKNVKKQVRRILLLIKKIYFKHLLF